MPDFWLRALEVYFQRFRTRVVPRPGTREREILMTIEQQLQQEYRSRAGPRARGPVVTQAFLDLLEEKTVEEKVDEEGLAMNYTNCTNESDLFTLEEFNSASDILYLKFPNGSVFCADRETFYMFLLQPVVMRNWVGARDDEGHGGQPGNIAFSLLPNRSGALLEKAIQFILQHRDQNEWELVKKGNKVPYGHQRGRFGVSEAHGQNSIDLYGLQAMEERANALEALVLARIPSSIQSGELYIKLQDGSIMLLPYHRMRDFIATHAPIVDGPDKYYVVVTQDGRSIGIEEATVQRMLGQGGGTIHHLRYAGGRNIDLYNDS
jgi:hypothetical protein